MKRIYVGNVPFTTTDSELRELFGKYGQVGDVSLPTDRETGRPRGFAFVELEDGAAGKAIGELDGSQLGGRTLRVNEAYERGSGGGGRGGRGGGGRDRW